jgi:hypothetical protein
MRLCCERSVVFVLEHTRELLIRWVKWKLLPADPNDFLSGPQKAREFAVFDDTPMVIGMQLFYKGGGAAIWPRQAGDQSFACRMLAHVACSLIRLRT